MATQFVTLDSLPTQHLTTAQIRASILARDAAEREDSQAIIVAKGVLTEETGRATRQHTYCAVYEDGTSYTYDGTRNGGKYQPFTSIINKFANILLEK